MYNFLKVKLGAGINLSFFTLKTALTVCWMRSQHNMTVKDFGLSTVVSQELPKLSQICCCCKSTEQKGGVNANYVIAQCEVHRPPSASLCLLWVNCFILSALELKLLGAHGSIFYCTGVEFLDLGKKKYSRPL